MKTKILETALLFMLAAGSILCWTDALAQNPLFVQPPDPTGKFYQSSSNGSDYDQFVWDDFTLQSTTTIAEIDWFGLYDPAMSGSGGPVTDFQVSIYASIAAGSQPDVTSAPLVECRTGGNAGETPVGQSGLATLYGYRCVLATPLQAAAGTKLWLQIEALQNGVPDWSIAAGTGGNASHFRRISHLGDILYQTVPGDGAFALFDQTLSVNANPGRSVLASKILSAVRLSSSGSSFCVMFPEELLGSAFSISDLFGRTVVSVQPIRSTNMTVTSLSPAAQTFILLISGNGHRFAKKLIVSSR